MPRLYAVAQRAALDAVAAALQPGEGVFAFFGDTYCLPPLRSGSPPYTALSLMPSGTTPGSSPTMHVFGTQLARSCRTSSRSSRIPPLPRTSGSEQGPCPRSAMQGFFVLGAPLGRRFRAAATAGPAPQPGCPLRTQRLAVGLAAAAAVQFVHPRELSPSHVTTAQNCRLLPQP